MDIYNSWILDPKALEKGENRCLLRITLLGLGFTLSEHSEDILGDNTRGSGSQITISHLIRGFTQYKKRIFTATVENYSIEHKVSFEELMKAIKEESEKLNKNERAHI